MVLLGCAAIADKLAALLTIHVWRGMSHHTAKHVFVTHTNGHPMSPDEAEFVKSVATHCSGLLPREDTVKLMSSFDDLLCKDLLRNSELYAEVTLVRNQRFRMLDLRTRVDCPRRRA